VFTLMSLMNEPEVFEKSTFLSKWSEAKEMDGIFEHFGRRGGVTHRRKRRRGAKENTARNGWRSCMLRPELRREEWGLGSYCA
jgi:hypothetical protein